MHIEILWRAGKIFPVCVVDAEGGYFECSDIPWAPNPGSGDFGSKVVYCGPASDVLH